MTFLLTFGDAQDALGRHGTQGMSCTIVCGLPRSGRPRWLSVVEGVKNPVTM